jgi:glycolate oxidase iron-sulfur subunit
MQTTLAEFIRDTPEGLEAQAILGKCVHCGFCTATCPTYQLLGDELDGPRGRIYLIKQMVEGAPVTASTQTHLDRCLTCRNCESTCPSGVQYGRLLEIGRGVAAQKVLRPWHQQVLRRALAQFLSNGRLFAPAFRLGQHLRMLLPARLRDKIVRRRAAGVWPQRVHARKMLLLAGCVQPAMMPNVNSATARVLDALGIETVLAPHAGCCGAIHLHLGFNQDGLDDARRNIDAWWPYLESGIEALVMNASGCGVTVKEYGHLLRDDPAYADKARRVSALTLDLAELLPRFETELAEQAMAARSAVRQPCTLQHGQQVRGRVEGLLSALGLEVRLPADAHLCCGSAGTYSILQADLSYQLRAQKLDKLAATEVQAIVSGNVGCIAHLQGGAAIPVMHWVELLDRMLA